MITYAIKNFGIMSLLTYTGYFMDPTKKKIAHTITERIVSRANDLGLKQTHIAEKLGKSRSTVFGWFNGAMPNADDLFELRKILRCSQDYLEGVTKVPSAKNENELFNMLDKTWELGENESIKTNAVLIPHYTVNSVIKAIAFPTEFLQDIDNYSQLAWCKLDNQLIIIDKSETKGGLNLHPYLVSFDDRELHYLLMHSRSGNPVIQTDDGSVTLSADMSIKVIGKGVFTGRPT